MSKGYSCWKLCIFNLSADAEPIIGQSILEVNEMLNWAREILTDCYSKDKGGRSESFHCSLVTSSLW